MLLRTNRPTLAPRRARHYPIQSIHADHSTTPLLRSCSQSVIRRQGPLSTSLQIDHWPRIRVYGRHPPGARNRLEIGLRLGSAGTVKPGDKSAAIAAVWVKLLTVHRRIEHPE